MTVAAIIYLFFEILLNQIKPTVLGNQSKHKIERYSREKATFLTVTFTLSSRNAVIQIQLNWTEAKVYRLYLPRVKEWQKCPAPHFEAWKLDSGAKVTGRIKMAEASVRS